MSTVFEHRETFPENTDPSEVYRKAYETINKTLDENPEFGPCYTRLRMERIGDRQYLSIIIENDVNPPSNPWAGLVALASIVIVIMAFVWPWL